MDRTKNLLDKIRNDNNRATLDEALNVCESETDIPEQNDSVRQGAGEELKSADSNSGAGESGEANIESSASDAITSDVIASDSIANVEGLLSDISRQVEDELSLSDSEEFPFGAGTSPYSLDPYVACPDGDSLAASHAPPRTIEDILKTISGCQIDALETDDPLAANSACIEKDRLEPATNDFHTDRNVESSSPELDSPKLDSPELDSPKLDSSELNSFEFDVLNFRVADEPVAPVEGPPDPFRSAYQLDQDSFELATEGEIETLDRQSSDSAPPLVETNGSNQQQSEASTQDAASSESDHCFWVENGEVLCIDGEAGFGHIDLACFEFSCASFQGNRIQISCDDGTKFQIEYQNVTHALFANGVEVELAYEEEESDSQAYGGTAT